MMRLEQQINMFNMIKIDNLTLESKIAIPWIAIHGMTDIYTYNIEIVLLYYSLSFLFIYLISIKNRFYLLLILSIYHIKYDYGYFFSIILHILWIIKPITSIRYLTFIHVPIHYMNTIKNINQIYGILFLNILCSILLNKFPHMIINNKNNMWWVAPVTGHVILR